MSRNGTMVRFFSLIVAIAMLLGLSANNMPVTAQTEPPGDRPSGHVPYTPNELSQEKVSLDEVQHLIEQKAGPVQILVELADEPTTQVYARERSAGERAATESSKIQLTKIEEAQQNFLKALNSRAADASVIYRTQRVYNGIALLIDSASISAIAEMDGVKAIHVLTPKTLDNASGVPLIGAPFVWNYGLGSRGEGIKIGIIDTGIDYLHTDFGGPGTGYADNDTTVVGDAPSYPGVKVIGGYDFAGDDYDANDPAKSIPAPDQDPMDCNGHGSHVAGTAAGYGVNADGTTYTGPYGSGMPFDTMRIGPGAAPEAELVALRVFGCEGSTNLSDLAIEWAVDPNNDGDFSDHLDVINMSLGSSYGSAYDSSAVASDNAALAGVIVVTSSGNSGDSYYITGSPGAATRAISTANSVDALAIMGGFEVDAPADIAGVYPATEAAFGPDLADVGPLTGDLVYANPATGCSTIDSTVAGKIALIDRGTCTFAAKVANAEAAGAIGVIIANNALNSDPITMGGTDPGITIPSQMIKKETGDLLKSKLPGTVTVTLTAEYRNSIRSDIPARVDTLSSSSSRGPRRIDSFLKPDLAAPGDTIFSAATGTGNEGISYGGTSMAAPHVAGVMAILHQLRPTWSVEELKALAMNTANHDLYTGLSQTGSQYGQSRIGAGRVDAALAAQSTVVLYNAEDAGAVSVSFGEVEVVGTMDAEKSVTVVNKGKDTATYNVSFDTRVNNNGVAFTVHTLTDDPLTSITINPGESYTFKVKMTANAALLNHNRDASVSSVQTLYRHWLTEESGYISLISTGSQPNLRLPVHVVARAASDMQAGIPEYNWIKDSDTFNIPLAGTDVYVTTSPADVSVLTALELVGESSNEKDSTGTLEAADLKYVGVMSDRLANTSMIDSLITFGFASYGNWNSLNEVEYDLYIDVDRDGLEDFVVYTTNYGSATGGGATDDFVSVLIDLNSGGGFVNDYINGFPSVALNTVAFNNNVMTLSLLANDLGLTDANATFDFYVVTFARDSETGDPVDVSDVYTYNAAAPAVDTTGGYSGIPLYYDLDGESIPVSYNSAYTENGIKGVLLLHHHNVGNGAEVIPFSQDRNPVLTFSRNAYQTMVGQPVAVDTRTFHPDYTGVEPDALVDAYVDITTPIDLTGQQIDFYVVNDGVETFIGSYTPDLLVANNPTRIWVSDFNNTPYHPPLIDESNNILNYRFKFTVTDPAIEGKTIGLDAQVVSALDGSFDEESQWLFSSNKAESSVVYSAPAVAFDQSEYYGPSGKVMTLDLTANHIDYTGVPDAVLSDAYIELNSLANLQGLVIEGLIWNGSAYQSFGTITLGAGQTSFWMSDFSGSAARHPINLESGMSYDFQIKFTPPDRLENELISAMVWAIGSTETELTATLFNDFQIVSDPAMTTVHVLAKPTLVFDEDNYTVDPGQKVEILATATYADYTAVSTDVLVDAKIELTAGVDLGGQAVHAYYVLPGGDVDLGTITLDPGQTSFWLSEFPDLAITRPPLAAATDMTEVYRFEITPSMDLMGETIGIKGTVVGSTTTNFETPADWYISSLPAEADLLVRMLYFHYLPFISN